MEDAHISVERRRFPRRAYKRNLGVLFRGQYNIAIGVGLSEGGLAFESDHLIEEGSNIVLNFQIPGGSFVSVIAIIRSATKNESDRYFYGCHYRNLKFDHKRQIRTYVSARSS